MMCNDANASIIKNLSNPEVSLLGTPTGTCASEHNARQRNLTKRDYPTGNSTTEFA